MCTAHVYTFNLLGKIWTAKPDNSSGPRPLFRRISNTLLSFRFSKLRAISVMSSREYVLRRTLHRFTHTITHNQMRRENTLLWRFPIVNLERSRDISKERSVTSLVLSRSASRAKNPSSDWNEKQ